MSRRKQAKPRSLKAEEEEWNEGASAADGVSKTAYSDQDDDDDNEAGDSKEEQDESESNKKDDEAGNDNARAEGSFEDAEGTEPHQTKPSEAELFEAEDMTDVADIKTESMDSFESGVLPVGESAASQID